MIKDDLPIEGVDQCPCGSKYWDDEFCHSCGERFVEHRDPVPDFLDWAERRWP